MLQWKLPATPNGRIILYSLKYNSTTLIVTNTSSDVPMYTVRGLSSENVYIFQVTAHTRAGEGPPINITVVIRKFLPKCHHIFTCSSYVMYYLNPKNSSDRLLVQGNEISA